MLHIYPNWAEECHDAKASKDTGYGRNYCLQMGTVCFGMLNKAWAWLFENNGGTYVEK